MHVASLLENHWTWCINYDAMTIGSTVHIIKVMDIASELSYFIWTLIGGYKDMEQLNTLITNPLGIMAIIMLTPAFFIWLEKRTKWKIFEYLPPIVWIFIVPIVWSNIGLIPSQAPIYKEFKSFAVPLFIVLMLLDVDIRNTLKVALRATGVMLFGAIGVVIGAIVAVAILRPELMADAWKGFAALAGSWIGGTGNLAAVAEGLDTPPEMIGIVVIADTLIYIVWFPLLLACKRWAKGFNKFAGVTEKHTQEIEKAIENFEEKDKKVSFHHLLILFGFGFAAIFFSRYIADFLPVVAPVLTAKTWSVMLVTTFGLLMAMTPLRKVPGTHSVSMALVYVYMSMIGAQADLANMAGAHWFLLAAVLCITLHGIFCVIGAKLFHVDVHLTAIASAANIGGAASAPVVAAYHRHELVPVSIMMALIGYAIGNYFAFFVGYVCQLIMS